MDTRQGVAEPTVREPGGGRDAQRRRTRKAIVEATERLLADGADPSIADIAAAADVSRRTVYMYFPTLDQLIIDATLGTMSGQESGVPSDFDRYGDDVHDRIDALVDALLKMSDRALPLGRRLLRLTVDPPSGTDADGAPRRGYRRVAWIEQALQPLRQRLTAEQFERLVSGLAVTLGWEAMIVLRDTRGLPPAAEHRVTSWTAHALIDAMLEEAGDGTAAGIEPANP